MVAAIDFLGSWLFSMTRSQKRVVQICFDCMIVPIAFVLAYYSMIENLSFFEQRDTYVALAIAITTTLFVFTALGQYNTVNRFSSFKTFVRICFGVALTCACLIISINALNLQIPNSTPIIFFVFFVYLKDPLGPF